MRFLTISLLCVTLALSGASASWAVGHHRQHRAERQVQKDIKKAKKQVAKKQRPKLLKHHK